MQRVLFSNCWITMSVVQVWWNYRASSQHAVIQWGNLCYLRCLSGAVRQEVICSCGLILVAETGSYNPIQIKETTSWFSCPLKFSLLESYQNYYNIIVILSLALHVGHRSNDISKRRNLINLSFLATTIYDYCTNIGCCLGKGVGGIEWQSPWFSNATKSCSRIILLSWRSDSDPTKLDDLRLHS